MAYFTYERDFAGRWQPVVYHRDKPRNADSAPVWPVPTGMMDDDGSPHFGALRDAFPAPIDGDAK